MIQCSAVQIKSTSVYPWKFHGLPVPSASKEIKSTDNKTAIDLAIDSGKLDIVELLSSSDSKRQSLELEPRKINQGHSKILPTQESSPSSNDPN